MPAYVFWGVLGYFSLREVLAVTLTLTGHRSLIERRPAAARRGKKAAVEPQPADAAVAQNQVRTLGSQRPNR